MQDEKVDTHADEISLLMGIGNRPPEPDQFFALL